MSTLLMLARASLWSRRTTVALTVLSVATSFALLLSVERLRSSAKASFEGTISGTDLLIGARGSSVQLLLYAVFRLGEPVPELSWNSYEAITTHPEVAWSVPISLGDSVRGFRVLGSTEEYFKHYRYGARSPLRLRAGRTFEADSDAVLGSEVARALGWSVGDRFPIQHGIDVHADAHDHYMFEVVGVLEPTGTPVDRTVHVSLAGLALAHHEPDEHAGHGHEGHREHAHEEHGEHDHDEQVGARLETVSAVMVGLRSKMGILQMRAWINDRPGESIMAVMPGRAFQQLWSTVGVAERTLRFVGILVALAGVLALVAIILATVSERRREMALLRSIGASPLDVAGLIVGEAVLLALASVSTALVAVYVGGWIGETMLVSRLGLRLSLGALTISDLPWVVAFVATAAVASLVPAAVSYRRTLSDGLLVRT